MQKSNVTAQIIRDRFHLRHDQSLSQWVISLISRSRNLFVILKVAASLAQSILILGLNKLIKAEALGFSSAEADSPNSPVPEFQYRVQRPRSRCRQ